MIERLKAMNLMARYGLGTDHGVSRETVRGCVALTLAVIREHVSTEEADRIIDALKPVWV